MARTPCGVEEFRMTIPPLLDVWLRSVVGVAVLSTPVVLLELWRPARPPQKLRGVPADIAHAVLAIGLTLPIANLLYTWLLLPLNDHGMFDLEPDMPAPLRCFFALLGIDFTLYWIHRAMHSGWLWPIHRWHHSATQLYWLTGLRAGFQQNVVYVGNSLFWALLMHVPAEWFAIGAGASVLSNHWMHMNVRLDAPILERAIITPRAHALHHSVDPTHHQGNYGAILAVWDRLFGTYVDPAAQQRPGQFGLAEQVPLPRVIAGV
jgi:sterol desaturase/sphingolipid hydroxylase (fatty acid hydroxylase superfamily)